MLFAGVGIIPAVNWKNGRIIQHILLQFIISSAEVANFVLESNMKVD